MRAVVVLNHFAVPAGEAGATRHAELFDRLGPSWRHVLIGSDRSLLTGERVHKDAVSFRAVRTTPYRGNDASRVVNWLSYSIGAFFAGVTVRRVDVVYASSPHLFTGVAGYLLAKVRRAAFVLEIRDLWLNMAVEMGYVKPASAAYRFFHGIERFLYRHADEIVVLAEGSMKAIRAEHPWVGAITLIPNGADPSMFVVDEPRASVRGRLGLSGLVMVYAGAHGPANGLAAVLDVADGIGEDLPEVTLLLVGDGVDKPRLVEDALLRRLDNVVFLDPVSKAQIPQVFHAADVGLHVLADVPLFRYGVSPNKLFDYMAAGLPVITNCPGEVADIVLDAGAGVAVEPAELEDGVRIMANASMEQLSTWRAAGRRYIEQHRSREILAARLEDVLDRALRS